MGVLGNISIKYRGGLMTTGTKKGIEKELRSY
jgi:hypothetical protein